MNAEKKTLGWGQNIVLFGLALFFSVILFLIDIKLPLTTAFGAMYSIVILYSWLLPGERTTVYIGIFCTCLMIIGFIESPPSEELGKLVGVNCIISMVVLWICVTLVAVAKKGFGGIERLLESLERKVKERTQQLEESRNELKESERLYRYLYENANEMYVSVDPKDASIKKCNQTLCKKLGYSKEELIGKPIFFVYHPGCMPAVEKAFKTFQESRSVSNQELILKTKNGKKIDVILNASAATDEEGNVLYSRSSWLDVTDYKKSQKALVERGKLLEMQNKELEQFVYIASHDLQEPLRTVTSFSEFLAEEYTEQFDENGKKSIEFILHATARMRALILGLLQYGNIGKNKEVKTVDCGKLIDSLRQDLGSIIEKTNAKITTEKLPKKIKAYPLELSQLFQNLITNALKFHRTGIPPEIFIASEQKNGYWQFAVQDNGIGIKTENRERIFNIFQRLHNHHEYEGTGIGLAHCQKIIDLHRGKIWVESEVDVGSTFYFTIPTGKDNL